MRDSHSVITHSITAWAILFGSAVCGGAARAGETENEAAAGPVRFSEHLLVGNLGYVFGVATADLDGDGIWDSEDFSDQLSEFLEQRFRYEPYHLKLASLDACLGLGDISPARHGRLTTMVRSILAI